MFGFGYALVPLYNIFCEITGLNGKSTNLVSAQNAAGVIDTSREITVEFTTNVNSALDWDFRPVVGKVKVHPGAEKVVNFEAVNHAPVMLVGRAVPSVSPSSAARYFSKTECFCFTEQRLEAGERRLMPVRFVVDAKLPAHVRTVTLAYTFFETPATAARDAFLHPGS